MAAAIWAVVPAKGGIDSKQRLAAVLSPEKRQRLALAMLGDVLQALAGVPALAGIAVVTADAAVAELASAYRARVMEDGARSGHTGAVTAASRRLANEGAPGFLTVPADVPLITPAEVSQLLAAHRGSPAFTIAPAHDERGSNAVLCSPPGAVELQFGNDSFLPHLAAAERAGLRPTVLRLPGLGLDIDNPEDLDRFARIASKTRARAVLDEMGLAPALG
jgi:2-phospho-L-lactate guanylyltransferase